jgi:hypothetical protein
MTCYYSFRTFSSTVNISQIDTFLFHHISTIHYHTYLSYDREGAETTRWHNWPSNQIKLVVKTKYLFELEIHFRHHPTFNKTRKCYPTCSIDSANLFGPLCIKSLRESSPKLDNKFNSNLSLILYLDLDILI